MDNALKRFEDIESELSKLRIDLNAQSALASHLAAKADVQDVKTDIAKIKTEIAKKELFTWVLVALTIFAGWCFLITKLAP